MYRLPQPVLGHIYEYDPTYRVNEHQKQMLALKARNVCYDAYDPYDVDLAETFGFQFSMYCASAVFFAIGIPLYAAIAATRLAVIILGLAFERVYRVL